MKIQSEYQEEIKKFEVSILESTKQFMEREGNIPALVVVLCKEKDEFVNAVVDVSEMTVNEELKNVIPKMIPSIMQSLSSDGRIPICFSFSFETWTREAPKDGKLDNWKDIPVSGEGIASIFETEYDSRLVFRRVLRGKEGVSVEPPDDKLSAPGNSLTVGRFANMFRKYNHAKDTN